MTQDERATLIAEGIAQHLAWQAERRDTFENHMRMERLAEIAPRLAVLLREEMEAHAIMRDQDKRAKEMLVELSNLIREIGEVVGYQVSMDGHEVLVRVRHAVADLTSRAEKAEAERDNWIETARQESRNRDYYRGLVQHIGRALGKEAFTQDDGGIVDEPLCDKVPALVETRLMNGQIAEAELRRADEAIVWIMAERDRTETSGVPETIEAAVSSARARLAGG